MAWRPVAFLPLALAALGACADTSPDTGPDTASDRLLVTSGFTDQIFVLDAETGQVLDSLALDRRPGERDEPHGITVSGDGRHFYATLAHGEPSLWKYETEGLRLVGRVTLPTYGASRVRLSPDGSVAAVPDYWLSGGGEVSRIAFVRTHDLTVLATPEVCPAPHDAAFSADGRWIAVPCALSDEVVLLDGSDFSERARYSLAGLGPDAATDVRPLNAAWADDGEHFIVTLHRGGGLARVSATQGVTGWSFPADRPVQVAVNRTSSVMATANRGEGTVTLSYPDSSMRTVAIEGAHPHGVALAGDPVVAYVTFEGDTKTLGGVVAIDVTSGDILWRTEVGVFTLGVAYLPADSSRFRGNLP